MLIPERFIRVLDLSMHPLKTKFSRIITGPVLKLKTELLPILISILLFIYLFASPAQSSVCYLHLVE